MFGIRITPACAGKTSTTRTLVDIYRDHPRVCGKNTSKLSNITLTAGSPPRVREKREELNMKINWSRITPACAGKTLIGISGKLVLEDHPRVCGKNPWISTPHSTDIGSPPRVRDKLTREQKEDLKNGITPACAGKTQITKAIM